MRYLELPLWLKANFRGHTFWAVNGNHLNHLERVIQAELRERPLIQQAKVRERFRTNQNMPFNLPAWILSAKNRPDLLRLIRRLQYLLHPPLLDEVGLRSALSEYVQGFGERSKISVDLELPRDLERLPGEVELSLFRIVQECLTNIHRHSGSHTARVRLSRTPGEIQVEVSDQGCGIKAEIQESFFAGRSTGVRLRGMRERVRQIGGALQIQSNGNGTSVVVVLPVRATDTESDNVKDLRRSPSK